MRHGRLVVNVAIAGAVIALAGLAMKSPWPLFALPGVVTMVAIRYFSRLRCPSCFRPLYVLDGDMRFTAEGCVHCGHRGEA